MFPKIDVEDPFAYKDLDLDDKLDNDDDEEQEVDRARPFQPGAASTPYHGGDEHQIQTMMHEQSGLPHMNKPLCWSPNLKHKTRGMH